MLTRKFFPNQKKINVKTQTDGQCKNYIPQPKVYPYYYKDLFFLNQQKYKVLRKKIIPDYGFFNKNEADDQGTTVVNCQKDSNYSALSQKIPVLIQNNQPKKILLKDEQKNHDFTHLIQPYSEVQEFVYVFYCNILSLQQFLNFYDIQYDENFYFREEAQQLIEKFYDKSKWDFPFLKDFDKLSEIEKQQKIKTWTQKQKYIFKLKTINGNGTLENPWYNLKQCENCLKTLHTDLKRKKCNKKIVVKLSGLLDYISINEKYVSSSSSGYSDLIFDCQNLQIKINLQLNLELQKTYYLMNGGFYYNAEIFNLKKCLINIDTKKYLTSTYIDNSFDIYFDIYFSFRNSVLNINFFLREKNGDFYSDIRGFVNFESYFFYNVQVKCNVLCQIPNKEFYPTFVSLQFQDFEYIYNSDFNINCINQDKKSSYLDGVWFSGSGKMIINKTNIQINLTDLHNDIMQKDISFDEYKTKNNEKVTFPNVIDTNVNVSSCLIINQSKIQCKNAQAFSIHCDVAKNSTFKTFGFQKKQCQNFIVKSILDKIDFIYLHDSNSCLNCFVCEDVTIENVGIVSTIVINPKLQISLTKTFVFVDYYSNYYFGLYPYKFVVYYQKNININNSFLSLIGEDSQVYKNNSNIIFIQNNKIYTNYIWNNGIYDSKFNVGFVYNKKIFNIIENVEINCHVDEWFDQDIMLFDPDVFCDDNSIKGDFNMSRTGGSLLLQNVKGSNLTLKNCQVNFYCGSSNNCDIQLKDSKIEFENCSGDITLTKAKNIQINIKNSLYLDRNYCSEEYRLFNFSNDITLDQCEDINIEANGPSKVDNTEETENIYFCQAYSGNYIDIYNSKNIEINNNYCFHGIDLENSQNIIINSHVNMGDYFAEPCVTIRDDVSEMTGININERIDFVWQYSGASTKYPSEVDGKHKDQLPYLFHIENVNFSTRDWGEDNKTLSTMHNFNFNYLGYKEEPFYDLYIYGERRIKSYTSGYYCLKDNGCVTTAWRYEDGWICYEGSLAGGKQDHYTVYTTICKE